MNHERGLKQLQKIFKLCFPLLDADIRYEYGHYHINILNSYVCIYNPYNFDPIYRFTVCENTHYDVHSENIYGYFYNILPNMIGKIRIHAKQQYCGDSQTLRDAHYVSNLHLPFNNITYHSIT